ncbi:hypothetical protein IMX26_10310 [Clostridium sp. 'deep sea']|uniref:hypothetical protein n=1 Tax=Clostridium sp. 'deep sea' TaxID=2779445 RepID=UPI0018968DED|nr:hypothetical protein [Clostridium sp. 'deep sea']QOR33884.1 hypothetical protein IMX26_10310 [Clostridium sp. 'deep sea']
MAFNVVDKQGNHIGIILGKCKFSIINEDKQENTWICALTNYKVEDFIYELNDIKKIWADRWNLDIKRSADDIKVFSRKIDQLSKMYQVEHLQEEEKLRYMHTKSKWLITVNEIKQKLKAKSLLLIDPLKAEIKNNKLIIATTNIFNEPTFPDLTTVYAELIAPVQSVSYYKDNSSIGGRYEVTLQLKSGNVNFNYKFPFPITNVKVGDNVQLLYDNGYLVALYIKDILYKLL